MAISHLINFIIEENHTLFGKSKLSGFYAKSENVEQLKTWLTSNKITQKLQNKFFEFENDEKFQEKIALAEQIISIQEKHKS